MTGSGIILRIIIDFDLEYIFSTFHVFTFFLKNIIIRNIGGKFHLPNTSAGQNIMCVYYSVKFVILVIYKNVQTLMENVIGS